MDTILDDSEKNAKVTDSAYSNSCSNSQSRRSHSTKSTHSGSNSSGSSGYGGKPSISGSSYNLGQSQKREKEIKKKKTQIQTETTTDVPTETENRPLETVPEYEAAKEEPKDVVEALSPALTQAGKGPESMDISVTDHDSSKDEVVSCNAPIVSVSVNLATSRPSSTFYCPGFSCVISMDDGVVMYATSSLTTTLGFPKDMWIGRSFIDFIHPRDRNTFASQITNGLAVPKLVNGTQDKAPFQGHSDSIMVCRLRRYRGLSSGFGVKERVVAFMPFLLKLAFKKISDEDAKSIYLVIQATPFISAFKIPNEILTKAIPFVMRHAASGNLEYIDPESVPYLGYLPQDVTDKDALQLYHPDDLNYLRQVYETIVKEGGLSRSKPYRMLTQNGDFIKVETEWSTFINPWSRKLEFVIGKHHIVEGPNNPDVFQAPDPEKVLKLSEEEKNKAKMIRESIVRIMNEVLTKPASIAKQQMSKRCHDLAFFVESILEKQPKIEDDLRVEAQDPDHHSCYERDSVMLGGISPHHDYNENKSSTETPLSYNQLNYNETLQRYFDSHQIHSYEEYNTITGENVLGLKDSKPSTSKYVPFVACNSADSGEMTSSCDSGGLAESGNSPIATLTEYQHVRLTESLLNRHNAEMEKELMGHHRETRSCSKGTRDIMFNEIKKKQKEHLANCNASFHQTCVPTTPLNEPHVYTKCHGVKRGIMHVSESGVNKHHCSAPKTSKRKLVTNDAAPQASCTDTPTIANNHWPLNPINNMNTFILGVGIPQQIPIISPLPAMSGMFPMYYAPVATAGPSIPSTSNVNTTATMTSGTNSQFTATPMQCMMYGQPVYGSPFMYSTTGHKTYYPMQQQVATQSVQCNTINPLGPAPNMYEETCKTSIPPRSGKDRQDVKHTDVQATSSKHATEIVDNSSSTNAHNRSTETVPATAVSSNSKKNDRQGNSEETVDRTDGESSYSSLYSSFFKTESGSAEESADAKKKNKFHKIGFWDKTTLSEDVNATYQGENNSDKYYAPQICQKLARRKMEPPWMEQVCVTSELVYKYQIKTKNLDEVLLADKKKMLKFEQPSLVNEQLGQLYLDLQLEGVAAKLTLEEGITSSSSSGDETTFHSTKGHRRKRGYSKLVMIYEEDAPLPPPKDGENHSPSPSVSTL